MSPSSSAEIRLLALRRLKNNFLWLAVVPIFTTDHERRMYSWIAVKGPEVKQIEAHALDLTSEKSG